MPSFALESVRDGKRIDSDSFQGKALLITFFATWCPPCLQEIPALVKLQEEFGSNGFSVVALSSIREAVNRWPNSSISRPSIIRS